MAPSSFDDETVAKILRQVEFYFSDSNILYDKFLLQCIKESDDGLVRLALICSFSRMRNFLGLREPGPDKVPPTTVSAVAEILRKSSTLRVSDDGQRVGRLQQLLNPEEVQEAVNSRTIAASPLPWRVTMAEIESFFSQYAKVVSVRLPRHPKARAFCGSALVEFATEEDVKKVMETPLVYQGIDLELRPKKLFDEETEKNNPPFDRQMQSWRTTGRDSAGQHNENFPKGLIVAFSLRKIEEDGNTQSKRDEVGSFVEKGKAGDENTATYKNVVDDGKVETPKDKGDAFDERKAKDAEEDEHEKLDDYANTDKEKEAPNLEGKESKGDDEQKLVHREDIKALLGRFGNVKYVDFARGATSGYVRFEHPEGAQKVRTAAVLAEEGGLVVKGNIATFEAVEGDAEIEYWAKLRGGQDRKREFIGDKFSKKRGRNNSRGKESGKETRGKDSGKETRGKESGMDTPGIASLSQAKHLHFDDDDTEDGPVSKKQEVEVH